MIADFPVLLDACVLANFGVCDLLLRLAEEPRMFSPRWSEFILEEVRRTHLERLKPPWPEAIANSWQASVRAAFEEDRVILEAVHRGIAHERTPHLNLPIDAGPLRFRRRVAEMIEAEQAAAGRAANAVTAAAPPSVVAVPGVLHAV